MAFWANQVRFVLFLWPELGSALNHNSGSVILPLRLLPASRSRGLSASMKAFLELNELLGGSILTYKHTNDPVTML